MYSTGGNIFRTVTRPSCKDARIDAPENVNICHAITRDHTVLRNQRAKNPQYHTCRSKRKWTSTPPQWQIRESLELQGSSASDWKGAKLESDKKRQKMYMIKRNKRRRKCHCPALELARTPGIMDFVQLTRPASRLSLSLSSGSRKGENSPKKGIHDHTIRNVKHSRPSDRLCHFLILGSQRLGRSLSWVPAKG
jgi:hypothetical protein